MKKQKVFYELRTFDGAEVLINVLQIQSILGLNKTGVVPVVHMSGMDEGLVISSSEADRLLDFLSDGGWM